LLGDTPAEAVERFHRPLRRALSCVTRAVVDVKGGYYLSPEPHELVLGGGDPVRLRGPERIGLSVKMRYRVVEAPGRRSRYEVEIVAYQYSLTARDGKELVAYHWHPEGESHVTTPHVHLGPGAAIGHRGIAGAHLPTDHVALVEVIRLALEQPGVEPLRNDWRDVLTRTQATTERYRR
jgi:hypothetical protein